MDVLGLLGVLDVDVQTVDTDAHGVLLFAQYLVVSRAELWKFRKYVQKIQFHIHHIVIFIL